MIIITYNIATAGSNNEKKGCLTFFKKGTAGQNEVARKYWAD